MTIIKETKGKISVAVGTMRGLKILEIRKQNNSYKFVEDNAIYLQGDIVRNVIKGDEYTLYAITNSNTIIHEIDLVEKTISREIDVEFDC